MSKDIQQQLEAGNEAFLNQDYGQAETNFKAALWEAERLKDNLKIADCLDRLAEVFFEQERYGDAEPLYQ
ncbi:MAG TPA: tetratricopeptide repeat protein, partial [Candidatus Melainabacteria bacterium]|nr:tetratricopeptide repeat protein [Candidatus Melainabacteria bacterium]